MTTRETSPPSKSNNASSKVGLVLVGVLALLAFIAFLGSGTRSPAPLLLAASTPLRVTVPTIDTTSSLAALGQKGDGSLDVPPLTQPMQAAWYDKSPMPGALGPAVILGHVNGGGKPGVFLRLANLKAGDQVFVDRQDGQTAVFTVAHVDTVPKSQFPAQEVYGDTPNAQLRLITCGGILDRAARSYESNVVVYADLTGVRKT